MKKKKLVFVLLFLLITLAAFAQQYKIGDKGPAGGIVFYDKGNYSNDWRYLEVAPEETEVEAPWGPDSSTRIGVSATDIGSGRQNTLKILEARKRFGTVGKAAQICDILTFNGFDDWFLPSKDELNLMYWNLKIKGLGGFSPTDYWSSSEDGVWSAHHIDFRTGKEWSDNKFHVFFVRAVRAF